MLTDKLRKKYYKLEIELYKIFLKLSYEFENSVALDEFVKRVEQVEKVEFYFPKDRSIQRFKKKIRKDYTCQMRWLVLKEMEKLLIQIYATKYLELKESKTKNEMERINRTRLLNSNLGV